MSRSPSRLGKGLSAIIGPRQAGSFVTAGSPLVEPSRIRQIPLDSIRPNPRQPRARFDDKSLEGLAQSIRDSGLLQPIVVRPTADQQFELVVGERRWRAAKIAGVASIPAIVRALCDEEALGLALLENLQREDLNPLERAAGYQTYIDAFGISVEGLADRLAESRANVANYLRLLKLRTEIREMLGSGKLGMGQARAIAGVDDSERQLALARIAVRRNLSVRRVEELAKAGTSLPQAEDREATGAAKHLSDLEHALSRALGLAVHVYPGRKKNSGRVVIHYNNLDEFDRIAEKVGAVGLLE